MIFVDRVVYMKDSITNGIVCLGLTGILFVSASTFAAGRGGVGLGATRLVYSEGDNQTSLSVRNTNPDNPFLIQAWVMTPDNQKSKDFIVTPPLFVLNPAKENVLRIMYVGPALASDRETLFYASVRAVPSTTKNEPGASVLKVATQSVIKLFWRPSHLPFPVSEAPEHLRCSRAADNVIISNPTPYFVTLSGIKIGGITVKNQMISPHDSYRFSVPKGAGGNQVVYRTINDYGAETPSRSCKS